MLNTKHIATIAKIDGATLDFYLKSRGFEAVNACQQDKVWWNTYRSVAQGYTIEIVYSLDDKFKEVRVIEEQTDIEKLLKDGHL